MFFLDDCHFGYITKSFKKLVGPNITQGMLREKCPKKKMQQLSGSIGLMR
jgi:hypothetical protein